MGDFDEATHTPALISEFRFVQNQNEEFELDVLEAYKKSRYCRQKYGIQNINVLDLEAYKNSRYVKQQALLKPLKTNDIRSACKKVSIEDWSSLGPSPHGDPAAEMVLILTILCPEIWGTGKDGTFCLK